MSCRATAGAAAVLLVAGLSGSAHAIMRRHDVPDSEYVIDADDYPQIVDLLEPGDCIGTLIAPSWILTAAHCAAVLPASGHTITIAEMPRPVEGVVCHPSYDGDPHDLALVKLVDPVEDVTPLPLHREQDEQGQRVLFVGRGDSGTGIDGQGGSRNDGKTRAATNTIVKTHRDWLEFVFNEAGQAAVTAHEGISGDGDSGGPALIETPDGLAVAGISSWQDARRRKIGKYGVHDYYARVSTDLEFIDEVTGPDWNGGFRRCPPESCCQIAVPGSRTGIALLMGCLVLFGRRRST